MGVALGPVLIMEMQHDATNNIVQSVRLIKQENRRIAAVSAVISFSQTIENVRSPAPHWSQVGSSSVPCESFWWARGPCLRSSELSPRLTVRGPCRLFGVRGFRGFQDWFFDTNGSSNGRNNKTTRKVARDRVLSRHLDWHFEAAGVRLSHFLRYVCST